MNSNHFTRWLARSLHSRLVPPQREPDFVIGDHQLDRWWLIPRNRFFNIYLHHVRHSDDDRALHDHPWWSLSLCLAGGMIDFTKGPPESDGEDVGQTIVQGDLVLRPARTAHRLVIPNYSLSGTGIGCWTLFITGPVIREWGFACPKGWVHWKDFTAARDGKPGDVGRGCGEME